MASEGFLALLHYLTHISCLDMINNVVLTAFKHPEIPLEDRSEEKDKDRVLCSANLVHQVVWEDRR